MSKIGDIFLNPLIDDENRRNTLMEGALIINTVEPSSKKLADYAKSMVCEAFGHDPEKAQYSLDVENFVSIAASLKSSFTNSEKTVELIREVLKDKGCDLDATYFDVPRLRIVTHGGYLSAGVGYAYKAHRDTWYSSPDCQLNWWMPVYDLTPARGMAIYPQWWNKAFANSSEDFDYAEWCAIGRGQAVSQISNDSRKHPVPLQSMDGEEEVRIGLNSGDILFFSAAHLHATVPNNTGVIRYSMDFRTVHLNDLESGKGVLNVDNKAKGTTLTDFRRASDLSFLPKKYINRYSK